jgi:asparagine synthase (glutamine-hydrolysing)
MTFWFLDYELIELALAVPVSYKVRGFQTKRILKHAFKDLLPPEIQRRGKMGFGVPIRHWLRNDWKDFVNDSILSNDSFSSSVFDKTVLRRFVGDHMSRITDYSEVLWAILFLELWYRIFIKRNLQCV